MLTLFRKLTWGMRYFQVLAARIRQRLWCLDSALQRAEMEGGTNTGCCKTRVGQWLAWGLSRKAVSSQLLKQKIKFPKPWDLCICTCLTDRHTSWGGLLASSDHVFQFLYVSCHTVCAEMWQQYYAATRSHIEIFFLCSNLVIWNQ